jgi:hypothetical protein
MIGDQVHLVAMPSLRLGFGDVDLGVIFVGDGDGDVGFSAAH